MRAASWRSIAIDAGSASTSRLRCSFVTSNRGKEGNGLFGKSEEDAREFFDRWGGTWRRFPERLLILFRHKRWTRRSLPRKRVVPGERQMPLAR